MKEPATQRSVPEHVSVVIPVFNAAATLPAQLAALAGQTYAGSWELVLADNGSSDDTCLLAMDWRDRLPALRVVDASDRRGAAHARNVGIAASSGPFIALCDADDVADPGWLAGMVAAASSGDLVGGRLSDERLNPGVRSRWRRPHGDDGLPTSMGFLPYAVSANFGGWADVFAAVGGWSEDYQHGGDDIEFCWRAQLAGYRLVFAPDAVMHYRYRDSLRGLAKQFRDYGMADPQLYKAFREAGASRPTVGDALRSAGQLCVRAPLLLSPSRRGRLIRRGAQFWGRVRGSARYGVFFVE